MYNSQKEEIISELELIKGRIKELTRNAADSNDVHDQIQLACDKVEGAIRTLENLF